MSPSFLCRRQMAGKLIPLALAFILGFSLAYLYVQIELHSSGAGDSPVGYLSHRQADEKETNFLLIIVFSAAKNTERRSVIRKTWLQLTSTAHRRIEHYFVVGSDGEDMDTIEALNTEHLNMKDLLILPYLKDNYETLTDKLVESLKWIARLQAFDFVLKVDDDSFVRIDALYDEMVEKDRANNEAQKRLYWGYFDGRAHVKRSGQWAEGNWFLCDRYLPYALGGGYLLSRRLVDYIVTNADLLQRYKSEDISLGVWTAPLAISRVHDTRFDTEFKSRGCIDSYLVSHKQSVGDMRAKYEAITGQGRLCPEGESERRLAYEYNWKVPPSKCCSRNVTMTS